MGVVDSAPLIEAVGALAVVLGLMALLAVGLRLWRGRGGPLAAPRLALVETLALDGRHRLVRVRDGAAEHVLLLGPQAASVVTSTPPSLSETAP